MDYSRATNAAGEVVDCADCRHSDTWLHYDPKTFRVCRHPAVVLKLGGPRSVRDLVRAPGGLCAPEGKLHAKPKVDE